MNATKLPKEILRMIFDYLTFNEKLIARLTSSIWNQICPALINQTAYHLNSKQSHQSLLDTHVLWENLKVSSIDFMLPTELRNSIRSLEFDLSYDLTQSQFLDCLKFIMEFPNLTDLIINIKSVGVKKTNDEDVCDTNSGQKLETQFQEFAVNLDVLSFKFPLREYEALEKFHRILSDVEKLNLVEYELKEFVEFSSGPTQAVTAMRLSLSVSAVLVFPFSQVHQLISNSSSTLRILNLEFSSSFTFDKFTSEVLAKLKNLKLTAAFIGGGRYYRHSQPSFLALQNFIATQKNNLKAVALPWISGYCDELLKKIVPRNIEIIKGLRKEHITSNFPKGFRDLKSLVLIISGSNPDVKMFNKKQCPSVQRVELDSLGLGQVSHEMNIVWIRLLHQTFVNLNELHFGTLCHFYLNNEEFQFIIQEFKKLQVLKIPKGNYITDYGVTGIEADYLEELVSTRKIFLCPETRREEVPRDKIHGSPISSLTNLKEFTLLNSPVTDAGIYFGFRFGSSLKKLTVGFLSKEVTDWGLHWLSLNNPKLEEFHGSFNVKNISAVGKRNLQYKFPLLESTRKYTFKKLTD